MWKEPVNGYSICEEPFILAERVECQNTYNNFKRTVQSNAQKLDVVLFSVKLMIFIAPFYLYVF